MTTRIEGNTNLFSAYPGEIRDSRCFLTKIIDLIKSIFRQIIYSLRFSYHKRSMPERQQCWHNIEWKQNSKGLIVMLHGLRSDPAAWHEQISCLQNGRDIDVFTPVVPHRGLCSLLDAAIPVLPNLLDYAEKNPGKPICLLGASNGARITSWLEVKMRELAPSTPVMVSNIAGVHFGSIRMNQMETLGLARKFYPNELREELLYGSRTATRLIEEMRRPLMIETAPRKFEYYATSEDISVPNLDSSLPNIRHNETHHLLHGHSHDSIVIQVANAQIASCKQWMQSVYREGHPTR